MGVSWKTTLTSKYAMSCFTIAFQATKRSMSTSDGLRSCGAMFFLMRDWFLEMVEPCLLALEMDVARETEPVSFIFRNLLAGISRRIG